MGVDIRLDPTTGDLDLSSGGLVLEDSTAQRLRIRLRFIKGEWFLDLNEGLPYYTRILVKSPNLGHIRKALRDRILSTDGVRNLTRLELDFERTNRRLTVSFRANGEDFELELEIP